MANKNYSTLKKAAFVGLAALTAYLPMKAKAEDNYSRDEARAKIQASYDFASQPVEFAQLQEPSTPKTGLTTAIKTDAAGNLEYSVCYSASSVKEFFNGMGMPFTLWRNNKATGKTEILPAYTRPFRSGGLLSPEWGLIASGINGVGYLFGRDDSLVYNPFGDNPKLTSGVLLDQIIVGAVAAGGGGGGSKKTEPPPADDGDDDDDGDDGGDTSSGTSSSSGSTSGGSSSSGSTSGGSGAGSSPGAGSF